MVPLPPKQRCDAEHRSGEEEDEGLPDFRKHASWELRTRLGQLWVQFYENHPDGRGIKTTPVDPEEYLEELAFTGAPLVVRVGSSEVLGQFRIRSGCLVVELAHIEGGGERVLPTSGW